VIEYRPLSFFDTLFRSDNADALDLYTKAWPLVEAHYPPGWCCDFWAPNRFLNRVIYHHLTTLGIAPTVLDFACYDGLLVKALRDQGIDVRGWESNPPWPAYEALGIQDHMNVLGHAEAVIAFNVAQEYPYRNLLDTIESINNGLPEVLFLDREPTRETVWNKEYFDPMFITKHGIQVVEFPNCVSDRSRAELLIVRFE
jgi:hypothetical protein